MNKKSIIYLLVVGIISFGTGWYLNMVIQNPREEVKTQPKEKQESNSNIGNKDSIIEKTTDTNNDDIDYSKKISGRFILDGAEYAGYNFVSSKKVLWTNELFPYEPDTLKISWIDKKTFMARFTDDHEDCPPRVWICQVVSFDGNRLVLNDIWTGWNDYKDEKKEFYKAKKNVNYDKI